jgi:hypothetical protein
MSLLFSNGLLWFPLYQDEEQFPNIIKYHLQWSKLIIQLIVDKLFLSTRSPIPRLTGLLLVGGGVPAELLTCLSKSVFWSFYNGGSALFKREKLIFLGNPHAGRATQEWQVEFDESCHGLEGLESLVKTQC